LFFSYRQMCFKKNKKHHYLKKSNVVITYNGKNSHLHYNDGLSDDDCRNMDFKLLLI
jgi:hypothetical protein